MSKSMRILTYNTQMRSALMETGFPPSIPPVYTAPLRAELIAEAILRSPEEIDIVCLNEVFDEPARAILSARLEAEFPYQVTKADTFYTRIVRPGFAGDLPEKIWDLTFGPLADLGSLAKLKLEDSGLFLASRYPFATVPASGEVADLLDPVAFVSGVPVVRFLMYEAASDQVKVTDFGVATLLDSARGSSTRIEAAKPSTGLFGTPVYMAPEQINSSDATTACDVWAFGVVAYECLTGQLPFLANDMASLRQAIAARSHVPATRLVASIPKAFDDWFDRACATRPEDRYPTIRTAAIALALSLEIDEERAERSPPPDDPRDRAERALRLGE